MSAGRLLVLAVAMPVSLVGCWSSFRCLFKMRHAAAAIRAYKIGDIDGGDLELAQAKFRARR